MQEQIRRDRLTAATAAAQQAADLSLQDSLATSRAAVSSNLVRLYKAPGGGWAADSMAPAGTGS